MTRFFLIMAAWLLPVSANAQFYASFDDDSFCDDPPAGASASPDRPASATETSPDKARVVRRGEQTVMLGGAPAAPGTGAKMASASSRY